MIFFSLCAFFLAPVLLFYALSTMNKLTRDWSLKQVAWSSIGFAVFRVTPLQMLLSYNIQPNPIALWLRSGDLTLTIKLLALPLSSVFLVSLAFGFSDWWFPKKEPAPTPQSELSDYLRVLEISSSLLVNSASEELSQANEHIRRDIKDIRVALQALRTPCQAQPIHKIPEAIVKLSRAMTETFSSLRSARVGNQGFN
ncbi:hypothetical protein C8R46DRAFT_1035260 [Mycena filopes]|nr:hypothetical protein C8R46DRAFT_1035260 [Mycena filopes]